ILVSRTLSDHLGRLTSKVIYQVGVVCDGGRRIQRLIDRGGQDAGSRARGRGRQAQDTTSRRKTVGLPPSPAAPCAAAPRPAPSPPADPTPPDPSPADLPPGALRAASPATAAPRAAAPRPSAAAAFRSAASAASDRKSTRL